MAGRTVVTVLVVSVAAFLPSAVAVQSADAATASSVTKVTPAASSTSGGQTVSATSVQFGSLWAAEPDGLGNVYISDSAGTKIYKVTE
jgi:hypothetical protein